MHPTNLSPGEEGWAISTIKDFEDVIKMFGVEYVHRYMKPDVLSYLVTYAKRYSALEELTREAEKHGQYD